MRSSLARESREDRAARRVSLRPASVCRASVCRERDDCEAPRPVLELARESRHPASATLRTTVSARRTRSRRDMALVSGSGADSPLSIHMGVPPSVRMEQQESFRSRSARFLDRCSARGDSADVRPSSRRRVVDASRPLSALRSGRCWSRRMACSPAQPAAADSLELISRSFNGVSEGLSRDDVLDNITLFWLTNTGVSAARLYWERTLGFFTPKGVKIPVAASAFPDELFRRRGVGRSRHIPTSSTTTSSPRAATSPPGSSRSCSRKNFAPASSRCANSGGERAPQLNAAVLHIPIAQPSAVRVPSAPGDYCFVSWKLYGPSLSRPLPEITCFPALLERVSSDFSAPATATLGPVTR